MPALPALFDSAALHAGGARIQEQLRQVARPQDRGGPWSAALRVRLMAQHYRSSPCEHGGARLGHDRRAVLLPAPQTAPVRAAGARRRATPDLSEFGADTEGRQRSVVVLRDARGGAAERDVDDLPARTSGLRSRWSLTMVESSFWAGTVPSHDSGGAGRCHQLPHAVEVAKYPSSCTRRHSTVSHSASICRGAGRAGDGGAGIPSEPSIMRRCCITSCSP
jgi:hypothetical protein